MVGGNWRLRVRGWVWAHSGQLRDPKLEGEEDSAIGWTHSDQWSNPKHEAQVGSTFGWTHSGQQRVDPIDQLEGEIETETEIENQIEGEGEIGAENPLRFFDAVMLLR
jgi:hypothetical protein